MANEPVIPVRVVSDLLAIALRKAGIVGIDEAIEQPMLNDAFIDLNDLLATWQRSRYLIYHLVNFVVTSTGAQTYTVGLNQQFNINPRPDRIESAFLRIFNNAPNGQFVDLAMEPMAAREDYDRIALKTLGTLPWRVFYDPTWPVGTLYPWPIPQAGLYGIGITFKETLGRFASEQAQVNLPPEYEAALKWSLAEVLRTSYQMPEDPVITRLAKRSLNAIRLANIAVPTLTMPTAVRNRGRAYDYHSDQ